jgi:zinc and cadmium transporter
VLLNIILATALDSLTGLLGVFSVFFKSKQVEKISRHLVSFATGALIGAAFLHLIPEGFGLSDFAGEMIVIGFIGFFFLERAIHWRHCHDGVCPEHPVTWLTIIGDAVHNVIDGLVIASSFLINPVLGWTTTLAIIAHEIPQELGNFGILIYSGFSKGRAIFWTFFSQATCILGGVAGFFLGSSLSAFLIPFAAGGFIYIAAVDLLPEIEHAGGGKHKVSLALFIAGVVLIELLKLLIGEV